MPVISPAYRGPLVIIAVGVGFATVGSVPVAITFSLGTRSSATIIGMGFVGFGFLLMLPGVFWCLMVRTHSFKSWRRRRRQLTSTADDDAANDDAGALERTPAISKSVGGGLLNDECRRTKCWPATYCDPPPLIVTDGGVCCAAAPRVHRDIATKDVVDDADDDVTEPLCAGGETRTSLGVVDEDDDSSRLLQAPSECHVHHQHTPATVSVVSVTDPT